jgi:3-hydroxyisobutyrate dehydrogenase-like beta-hydroxyacid dehydrogenase
MLGEIAIIGFGEAGRAFAQGWRGARVYDKLTDDEATRVSMLRAYEQAGVDGRLDLASALSGAQIALSLVTASEAAQVAWRAAEHLSPAALYYDCNSVAPTTKRASAAAIEALGACYVDVAVMSPVHPARLDVPLLLSGSEAEVAAMTLRRTGFRNCTVVSATVGDAAAIKMIRSVMIKGIEALTAECMLAAEAAGVTDHVLASLDANSRTQPWHERADYNLDRMLVHGMRRAEEMEEVGNTLDDLGVEPRMSRAAGLWQREIGQLKITAPKPDLTAKLRHIRSNLSGTVRC